MITQISLVQLFIIHYMGDGRDENDVAIQHGINAMMNKCYALEYIARQLGGLVEGGWLEKVEHPGPLSYVNKIFSYSITEEGLRLHQDCENGSVEIVVTSVVVKEHANGTAPQPA